jgi:hypothetical protein
VRRRSGGPHYWAIQAKHLQDPISIEKNGYSGEHVILATAGTINKKVVVQACPGQMQDFISKITREKGLRGMAQVVEPD